MSRRPFLRAIPVVLLVLGALALRAGVDEAAAVRVAGEYASTVPSTAVEAPKPTTTTTSTTTTLPPPPPTEPPTTAAPAPAPVEATPAPPPAPRPARVAPPPTTAPPPPPPPPPPPAYTERRDIANQLVSLINQERARNGLGQLAVSGCLSSQAQSWANHLAESGTFAHNLGGCASGQNIASNYSAEGTFQSWMNSAGHRDTMLAPRFTVVGVGVAQVADGSIRVVADFG